MSLYCPLLQMPSMTICLTHPSLVVSLFVLSFQKLRCRCHQVCIRCQRQFHLIPTLISMLDHSSSFLLGIVDEYYFFSCLYILLGNIGCRFADQWNLDRLLGFHLIVFRWGWTLRFVSFLFSFLQSCFHMLSIRCL